MPLHERRHDHFREYAIERGQRPDFVLMHETAEIDEIESDDRRQAPLRIARRRPFDPPQDRADARHELT